MKRFFTTLALSLGTLSLFAQIESGLHFGVEAGVGFVSRNYLGEDSPEFERVEDFDDNGTDYYLKGILSLTGRGDNPAAVRLGVGYRATSVETNADFRTTFGRGNNRLELERNYLTVTGQFELYVLDNRAFALSVLGGVQGAYVLSGFDRRSIANDIMIDEYTVVFDNDDSGFFSFGPTAGLKLSFSSLYVTGNAYYTGSDPDFRFGQETWVDLGVGYRF